MQKPSDPCHVGIHKKALAEYFQMSTHMPGFLHHFVFAKLATISIRVNPFWPEILTIFAWSFDTHENNLGVRHKFTKYLKESCGVPAVGK